MSKIPYKLKCLREGWSFPKSVVDAVYYQFDESFDSSDEYLSLMDGLEVDTPKEAWEDYCKNNDIEHEINNNPF